MRRRACIGAVLGLSACTLTSDSYEPPLLDAEQTEAAPLGPLPPAAPAPAPAAPAPSTPSSTPRPEEPVPGNVGLVPEPGNEGQLGEPEAPASEEMADVRVDAGGPPLPPGGPAEPDAGAPPPVPPVPVPPVPVPPATVAPPAVAPVPVAPPATPVPPVVAPPPVSPPPVSPPVQPPAVQPPPLPPCPGSTFQGSCYQFFGTFSTWAAAEASCVALGGHLASVRSAAEDTFLESWAEELGFPIGTGGGIWLGGTDTADSDVFSWSDGSTFTNLNWAANQPDNGTGAPDCLEKRNDAAAQWFDRRCTDSLPYVCERPL